MKEGSPRRRKRRGRRRFTETIRTKATAVSVGGAHGIPIRAPLSWDVVAAVWAVGSKLLDGVRSPNRVLGSLFLTFSVPSARVTPWLR